MLSHDNNNTNNSSCHHYPSSYTEKHYYFNFRTKCYFFWCCEGGKTRKGRREGGVRETGEAVMLRWEMNNWCEGQEWRLFKGEV